MGPPRGSRVTLLAILGVITSPSLAFWVAEPATASCEVVDAEPCITGLARPSHRGPQHCSVRTTAHLHASLVDFRLAEDFEFIDINNTRFGGVLDFRRDIYLPAGTRMNISWVADAGTWTICAGPAEEDEYVAVPGEPSSAVFSDELPSLQEADVESADPDEADRGLTPAEEATARVEAKLA